MFFSKSEPVDIGHIFLNWSIINNVRSSISASAHSNAFSPWKYCVRFNLLNFSNSGLFKFHAELDNAGFRLWVISVKFPNVWINFSRRRIAFCSRIGSDLSISVRGQLSTHFCGIMCSIVSPLGSGSASLFLLKAKASRASKIERTLYWARRL